MATETHTLPIDDIVATLDDDGATWWNDEHTIGFRLTIETDDVPAMEHINDADCWGRVAWVNERDRYAQRPAGFTGAAMKLYPNGWHMDSPVWWEPYREGHKVYASDTERAEVTRLLNDGFLMVTVTRLERVKDSTNGTHVVVVGTASLSGIDTIANGYLGYVVSDLVSEVVA